MDCIGFHIKEWRKDMKLIPKKYQNGASINGLKNYNRNFMVDDFTYRFSKQHKDVNKDQVGQVYDNSIVNLIPYNNFKVNDGKLFNGSGFYVSKVDPQVYNQYQSNYNRTTDPDLKTYYGNALKVLNTKQGTINLESSKDYGDKINETFSHENRHYYDDVLPGLNQQEISKLSEAYPKLNVDKSKWLKEATATNTELRRAISQRNNNVIKEDLDQVINNMSDQDLYNMYTQQNGYSTVDNYYFRNKNQEFLDYQKTPEYKDQYLPYVKYRQQEDALQSDLNAYDYAQEKRFGMIALDKAKQRTKQAKQILKQRKKSNYQASVFPESVINMYNKYHKANLNEQELDPNKMQKIRTALKDVAYNYRGNVNYAKQGNKLVPGFYFKVNSIIGFINKKGDDK